MAAVEIRGFGDPAVLTPTERPVPVPAAGEVLIRVAAAGVNRPDVFQRKGGYPPPPGASDLPGLEVAGTVVATGAGGTRWREGDEVCALLAGGGYAEYAVAPEGQCLPRPGGPFDDRGSGRAGNLLHRVDQRVRAGAITGRRVAARARRVQRHRHHRDPVGGAMGRHGVGTAGSADKCATCERLGAARCVNYRDEDFVAVLREATGDRGVDVILDMVGGEYVARNLSLLAEDGRLVQIAVLQGSTATVNAALLMRRRLTFTGSTLRPRPVAEKARIAVALEAHVWPWLEAGEVRPQIFRTFPLARAADAHALMESSTHVGKIVLTV